MLFYIIYSEIFTSKKYSFNELKYFNNENQFKTLKLHFIIKTINKI